MPRAGTGRGVGRDHVPRSTDILDARGRVQRRGRCTRGNTSTWATAASMPCWLSPARPLLAEPARSTCVRTWAGTPASTHCSRRTLAAHVPSRGYGLQQPARHQPTPESARHRRPQRLGHPDLTLLGHPLDENVAAPRGPARTATGRPATSEVQQQDGARQAQGCTTSLTGSPALLCSCSTPAATSSSGISALTEAETSRRPPAMSATSSSRWRLA